VQSHRFPEDSIFTGELIDRARPLQFRLDGDLYFGFGGDSLFTALRANGKLSIGPSPQAAVSFDRRAATRLQVAFSPTSMPKANALSLRVEDGMELFTRPKPSFMSQLRDRFMGQSTHLTVHMSDRDDALTLRPSETIGAELLVVGGGIAGMQAAISAATDGQRVLLIEQSNRLGGMCDYYGRAEDDEDPTQLIGRLAATIQRAENIDVLFQTTAIDARDDIVIAKQIIDGEVQFTRIHFKKVVLATGAAYDRFADHQHMPNGVWRAVETYRLAADYGIMPPQQAHILTGGNSGYRLAQLLKENAIAIDRVWDPRPAPNSRHVDFAKAIGIVMSQGQALTSVNDDKNGVRCTFGAPSAQAANEVVAPSLIVSDAPVPDIQLWSRLGGMVNFDNNRHALYPDGDIPNVEIIGSAAGAITQAECLEQAQLAVRALYKSAPQRSGTRLGHYRYEDFPQPLTELHGGPLLDRMRANAQVPSFVGPPNAKSCTEYAFNRFLPKENGVDWSNNSSTQKDRDVVLGQLDDKLFSIMAQRFAAPKTHKLTPMRSVALQEGQVIYDTDGVAGPSIKIGMVTRLNDELVGIFEESELSTGDLVYVRNRTGLVTCQIG
jgi:hypothetical protein